MADSERNPEEMPFQGRPMPEAKKLTCLQRLASIKNNITVEPSAFLMLTVSILSGMATQNLSLQKACKVNLNISESVCESLNSIENSAYEPQVQQYVSVYISSKTIITSLLPAIYLVFGGGWMDLTGRKKILIMLPVIGEIFQNTSNILNVAFFYQLRVEYLYFLDAFFGSVAGGWSLMFLAVFSYIADITTNENRTHRLGIVSFCTYVGIPMGLAMSGVILSNFGYYAMYGSSLTMHLLNLLYIIFTLSDPPRTKDQEEHDGKGLLYFLKTFFDLAHIKDTLLLVFKKTSDNRRLKLCILLGCVCLLFGPMYGEISVMYLSTRFRFNWDEVQFSIFQTYNFITHTVGTIFSVLVFSKKLQWHDAILGIISTVSKICASFVFCFAPTGRIFYIGPLVDMLNGTSLLAIRSIFSKMVAPNELGKVNSIVGLAENLMPLVYVPLYAKVYTATMEVLPGAVFLMGASMTIPAIFVFIWLFWEHKKSLRKPKLENGTELHMS